MSSVPNAPGGLFDPFWRRVEFADVFAEPELRPAVAALVAAIGRGQFALRWIGELFIALGGERVVGVRAFDRTALRRAYAMLLVEEPAISAAVRALLAEFAGGEIALHVVDAVGDVVGAATRLDWLAAAWASFVTGDTAVGL